MISDTRQSIIQARFETGLYPPSAIMAGAEQFLSTHQLHVELFDDHATVALIPRSKHAPDVTTELADAVVNEALRQALRMHGDATAPPRASITDRT